MTVEIKFGGLTPEIALELLNCAAAAQAAANGMARMTLNNEPKESAPAVEEPVSAKEAGESSVTFEQVRTALAEKSHAGKTAEVKALIAKHGAKKITDVHESEYAALLAEAEAL